MPNLNIVICPGCGSKVPYDNQGCADCGYENNDDSRLLTITEILERPSYPASGAMRLNDVSPAFLQAVVAAAQSTQSQRMTVSAITREEALALAEKMIAAARSYERPEYQAGYFEGLVAGWWQCGIIAEDEMMTMRKRMRDNLATCQPAWWDLAARLGL